LVQGQYLERLNTEQDISNEDISKNDISNKDISNFYNIERPNLEWMPNLEILYVYNTGPNSPLYNSGPDSRWWENGVITPG
jgi:hypothetical protein